MLNRWNSVASSKNDDGTISFITIDPTRDGFEIVKAERNGNCALIIREGQHEYVLVKQARQGNPDASSAPSN
jgi:hypothetical protein